ncbi:MAG: hypothetical protein WKG07_30960 [Hymenobacter sp.]
MPLKTYLHEPLPLLLLAAKLVVMFPLLLEDLTHLGRWAALGFGGTRRPEAVPVEPAFAQPVHAAGWRWGWALLPLRGAALGHGEGQHRLPGAPRGAATTLTCRPPSMALKLLQISDLHTGSFNVNLEPLQPRRGHYQRSESRPHRDDRRPGERPWPRRWSRTFRRWRASSRSCPFSPSSATTTTATTCSGQAPRPSAKTCSA